MSKAKAETDEEKATRVRAERAAYVDLLCAATMETDKGIKRLCDAFRQDTPEFPPARTIRTWIADDADFAAQYARAKEMQADYIFEQVIEIADDASEDEIFVGADDETGASGKRVLNSEFLQRSKLRVDTRKWVASKLMPKKYGDRQILAGDEDNPLFNLKQLSDDLLEQRLALLESKG